MRRFMPARVCRCHSTYIDSMLRAVAIRSGIWTSAWQARHQALMVSSEGA